MWKRPESVLVVVVEESDGDVLLLRRRQPRGFWQSVTGSLLDGETPQLAAQRELLEETGLTSPTRATGRVVSFAIHPAWRERYAPGVEHNREHHFVCVVPAPVPIAVARNEHCAYAWLDAVEASHRVSSKSNREAIEAIADARSYHL